MAKRLSASSAASLLLRTLGSFTVPYDEGGQAHTVVPRLARMRRAPLQANVLGLARKEACGHDEAGKGDGLGAALHGQLEKAARPFGTSSNLMSMDNER